MKLHEMRCIRCNKLLARAKGIIEVRCPRCDEMNTLKTK